MDYADTARRLLAQLHNQILELRMITMKQKYFVDVYGSNENQSLNSVCRLNIVHSLCIQFVRRKLINALH